MSEGQAKYVSFDAFQPKKKAEYGEWQALSPQERKLLDIIRELDYGEIEKIIVKRGEPVFVKLATKDIKLD